MGQGEDRELVGEEAGPVGQASCQAQRRKLDFVLGQSGAGCELGSAGVTL